MASLSISGQSKQRQVVMLAVGGLLLGGLLLFQGPKTLKLVKGESPPTVAPSTQQPPPVVPPPVSTPGSPTAPASPPSPVRPALGRFKTKDPFVQQVSASAAPSSASSSTSSPSAPPAAPPATPSASFSAVQPASGKSATRDTAVIAVNGVEETVSVSTNFPKANPVFKLVSLGNGTAKVGVSRGSLKGSETVTLTKGEPLTLLNTVDGKRYRLELK
jgi:hypothetical protein